jgi:tetrahydromethanopterin S-methyltransferase subunit B
MSPFMIPIFAMMIPMVAIIADAFKKAKMKTDPKLLEKMKELENKVEAMELTLNSTQEEVYRLEKSNRFLTKLLEDKT